MRELCGGREGWGNGALEKLSLLGFLREGNDLGPEQHLFFFFNKLFFFCLLCEAGRAYWLSEHTRSLIWGQDIKTWQALIERTFSPFFCC